MVTHTRITTVDDLDGTPATHTHHLTLDGRCVRLDLNDVHHADLLAEVGGWMEAGTPVRQRVRPTPTRGVILTDEERAAVRAFGRAAGYRVGDRGRIANTVVEAWRAAGEPRP